MCVHGACDMECETADMLVCLNVWKSVSMRTGHSRSFA